MFVCVCVCVCGGGGGGGGEEGRGGTSVPGFRPRIGHIIYVLHET